MQPETAPRYLVLDRQGFNATGGAAVYRENRILTQRVRQAYPNQATLDASAVSLDDYVYSTDVIVGGPANSSTETSPVPVCKWAKADRRTVGNTLPASMLEIVAFHRNARQREQAACVEWTVSDGTTTLGPFRVSQSVVSGAATDLNPVIVYRPAADIDISALVNGLVYVDTKVYPWIGGAASVANSATDTTESRNFCRRFFNKHPTKAASPPFAYVSPTGVDATVDANGQAAGITKVSTNAATAAANPFLTIASALNALRVATIITSGFTDGCIVRLQEGTFTLTNPTVATYHQRSEVIIEGAPGTTRANVIVSFGSTANWACQQQWLRWRNLSMTRTGAFAFQAKAAGGKLIFENVALNNGSNSSTLLGSNFHGYVEGLTVTNPAANVFSANATLEWRLLRGLDYGAINNAGTPFLVEHFLVLGSVLRGCQGSQAAANRTASGSIVAFNRWLGMGGSASGGLTYGGTGTFVDVNGLALVQNVFEFTGNSANTAIRISGDADKGNVTHFLFMHNSMDGFNADGRGNLLYNDDTSAYPTVTLRTHKLCAFVGNIHVQINTKHDVFVEAIGNSTPRPDVAPQYITAWPYLYGVGCRGEFSQFQEAGDVAGGSFRQAYFGLKANIGTSNTVRNDPLYTARGGKTATGAGGASAGNGTYTLQAGSPARNRVADPVLRFDLAGTARPAASDAAGAYGG
jgi:hypothetical protein